MLLETTFTAPFTTTYTYPATVIATCLTSGQTIPAHTIPTGTLQVITCSTTVNPEFTETLTYPPGVSGIFFPTTRTASETITSICPEYTDVTRNILPDYKIPTTCDTIKPLTWAVLVITFVTIQLTRWIFDIPLLWTKGAGLHCFLDSVSWSCLRAHAAGSAGVITARNGSDTSQFARVYHMGMKRQDTPPEWTAWKLYSSILTDLLTVVTTGMTLYEACTLPEADVRRHLGVELWAYPSLSVALIGLSLLLGERCFPRTPKGNTLLLPFILGLLFSVGPAVALILWKFDTTGGDHTAGMWWLSIVFYVVVSFPWLYTLILYLHIFACMAGWFFRVGGVGFAALSHYAGGQPYCKLPGAAFGALYLTMGAVATTFVIFGGPYHYSRYHRT